MEGTALGKGNYEARRNAMLSGVKASPSAREWHFDAPDELHFFIVSCPRWTRSILVTVPFVAIDAYAATVMVAGKQSRRAEEDLFPARQVPTAARALEVIEELARPQSPLFLPIELPPADSTYVDQLLQLNQAIAGTHLGIMGIGDLEKVKAAASSFCFRNMAEFLDLCRAKELPFPDEMWCDNDEPVLFWEKADMYCNFFNPFLESRNVCTIESFGVHSTSIGFSDLNEASSYLKTALGADAKVAVTASDTHEGYFTVSSSALSKFAFQAPDGTILHEEELDELPSDY
jgi:hypothetical protein